MSLKIVLMYISLTSCLCWYTHSTIHAQLLSSTFCAWWYAGMCAAHIMGRNPLRPPQCECACVCVCACVRVRACVRGVRACVRGVPGPRWNDASPGAGARGGGSTYTQLTPL